MPFPAPSKKQAGILWMSVTAVAVAIFLAIIGVVLVGTGWVINRLAPVFLPLAVGAIVAYLLDPIVDWIEAKYRFSRLKAIIVVFLGLGVVQLGLIMTVLPDLIVQSNRLIEDFGRESEAAESDSGDKEAGEGTGTEQDSVDLEVSSAVTNVVITNVALTNVTFTNLSTTNLAITNNLTIAERVANFVHDIPKPTILENFLNDENQTLVEDWVRRNGSQILSTILQKTLQGAGKIASLTGFVIGFAMVPVYVFFFLLEEKRIVANWKRYVPVKDEKWRDEIVFVLTSINDSLIVFFRGQVLVGLCLGALIAIGFSIIGLKYAILLGIMAAVLSIIPYLGVILSVLPAIVIAIIQPDGPHVLLVLLVFVLVQMAEGLVISPKIIGDRVGMHPLTIIIAVLIGTTLLGGIVGGVLAIPLTAALRAIMFRYVWKTEPKKRRQVREASEA